MNNLLKRRSFIPLCGAFLSAPFVVLGQQLPPVKFFVVRRPAAIGTDNCRAPCIRGSIYDVTHESNFAAGNWSIPSWQEPICDVIERPWANNEPNVSAIPAGEYTAFARSDATKSWMTNINRSYRLQLSGTEPRTAIQFHYGQDVAWSEGCFIVGDHIADDVTIGDLSGPYCRVENGEEAIARLRTAVEAPDVDGSQITIAVSDRETLFLNANQGC